MYKNTKINTPEGVILLMTLVLFLCFQNNGEYYRSRGLSYYKAKNYEKAIEDFTKGISINDRHVSSNYFDRGKAYSKLEKFDLAEQDFQKVLETEKTNCSNLNRDIYWRLAWVAGARGENSKELELYNKALEYDLDNPRLRQTYALNLIENGYFREGVDILSSLVSEIDCAPYIYNNRALGYIKLGEYERASADLRKSLEIDANNPFVYRNYALLYSETERPYLACENINKALSLDIMEYGVRKHVFEFKELKYKYCF